jgi:hypothetical protein
MFSKPRQDADLTSKHFPSFLSVTAFISRIKMDFFSYPGSCNCFDMK